MVLISRCPQCDYIPEAATRDESEAALILNEQYGVKDVGWTFGCSDVQSQACAREFYADPTETLDYNELPATCG